MTKNLQTSEKRINFAVTNIASVFDEHTKQPCPGGGMVDALVSGASAERRASSSLVLGTISAS